jgi:hypothetical protein
MGKGGQMSYSAHFINFMQLKVTNSEELEFFFPSPHSDKIHGPHFKIHA